MIPAKDHQPGGTAPSSSSTMISPNNTFYDPDSEHQNLEIQAQRYQQWMNTYQDGQQQQQQQQQPSQYSSYSSNHSNHLMNFDFYGSESSYAPQPAYGAGPSYQHQQQHHGPSQHHQSQHHQHQYSQDLYPPPPAAPAPVPVQTAAAPNPQTARRQPSRPLKRPPVVNTPPVASKPAAKKRKVSRKSTQDRYSDSDSDYDDSYPLEGGISVGMEGLGVPRSKGRGPRLPGACTHCKKLKMKCDFPEEGDTCKRCKSGGHPCVVEGRKPRIAPNKREYLLAQIRQKDSIIESLLKQLHNPYLATPLSIASYRMATSPTDQGNKNIIAWLDRLQASVRETGMAGGGAPSFRLDSRKDDTASDGGDSDGAHNATTGTATPAKGKQLTPAQQFGLVPVDDDGESTLDSQGGGNNTPEDDEQFQNSLPDSHVPIGLIANLSLSHSSKLKGRKDGEAAVALLREEENLDDDNVGVASETYFMPGPATDLDIRAMMIEQHSPPEIIVHGLVTPDDVDKLFEIFYKRVNPFLSILDPVLHTPASTFARCPFLFTVICAISSRYYTDKSEIYPIAMHFAKHSAANALIDGWKSVELCQAYILMSTYAVPAKKWEEDRSWLYTGLAIRIATDLNLHQVTIHKSMTEKQEREVLNKIRVWTICFNLDRSTATQFGKPATIKDDYITRHTKDWYKKSQYNIPYDVHMCGHTALLLLVGKFHEEIFSDPTSPTCLNKQVNFQAITLHYDGLLTSFKEEWTTRFREWDGRFPQDDGANIRRLLLPFLVEYSRLVMYSFGFQQSFQSGVESGDSLFFTKCLEAAKAVIRGMIEDLTPTGFMCYAPDGHFVFAAFASAFLLKLLRPEFSHLMEREQENEVFDLISRLIRTLSSSTIAIDDRHTPKLYARFLAGLISRHRRDGATAGRLQTQPPPPRNPQPPIQNDYSQGSGGGVYTPSSSGGGSQGDGSLGYMPQDYGNTFNTLMDTPIYRPEATYTAGAGAVQFSDDMDILNADGNPFSSDEGMLATMQALKNPAWWQTMMMPGFSWPEPMSPTSNASSRSSPGGHSHVTAPLAANFGIFHATQPVAPH